MVGLIANPKAGNGKAVEILSKFEKLLLKNKLEHILVFTKENLDKVINEFEENNIKHLIVFGGDGTVNSVAKRILYKDMGLVVIPGGSGNDFSKSNWKDIEFQKLIFSLKENKIYYEFVDVGYIKELDIYFFNSFGIGIAGNVAKNVKFLKNYKISTIKSLAFDYKTFKIRVNEIYEGKAISFHIGINKIEGHGIKMFPNAQNNDNLLDFVIFKNVPYFQTFIKILKVLKGNHIFDKYVIYNQFSEIYFEIDKEIYGHYDGEVFKIGKGSYSVICLNKALKIIKWN